MKILAAVVVLVIVLVVIVVLQPADFRVTRSAVVAAPPAAVFAQVNDFHKWAVWNPWGKIDPSMKQTYEGTPARPGAVYTWAGNKEVGEGRMTITDSQPNKLVRIRLDFYKPFAGTNTAEFNFVPESDQTRVTWSMFGPKNFMAKAVHLVINMDKMIGGQFEKGLADMKAAAEASARS